MFEVNYHAVTGQPSEGLFERTSNAYGYMPIFRLVVSTLRERTTTLAGIPAEELLAKLIRPVTQHNFNIERRTDERRTLEKPHFSLKLTTGTEYQIPVTTTAPRQIDTDKMSYYSQENAMVHKQDNASLSDDQVLKLWDGIVASVRKR